VTGLPLPRSKVLPSTGLLVGASPVPPLLPAVSVSQRDSPVGVFPPATQASPPRRARRVLPGRRCLSTCATQHDPRAHPRAPVPCHLSMTRWHGPRRIRPAVRPTSPRCPAFARHPPASAVHAHPSSPGRALEGWVSPAAVSRSRLPVRYRPRRTIPPEQPSAFHRFDSKMTRAAMLGRPRLEHPFGALSSEVGRLFSPRWRRHLDG
jgi:hypothetical protein